MRFCSVAAALTTSTTYEATPSTEKEVVTHASSVVDGMMSYPTPDVTMVAQKKA